MNFSQTQFFLEKENILQLPSFFIEAFFSTVSYRLEIQDRGTRFPF